LHKSYTISQQLCYDAFCYHKGQLVTDVYRHRGLLYSVIMAGLYGYCTGMAWFIFHENGNYWL